MIATQKNTINALTSLRFIFALMIFLHHFNVNGKALFYNGFVGVTFFFMLSGFVLALGYEEKIIHKRITNMQFFIKRLIRLYPLHILCFFVAAVLAYKSLSFKSVLIAVPNLAMIQSWIPVRSVYFSFNAVSWCLSNMIFFYAVFPFLAVFFNRTGKMKSFAIIVTVAAVLFFSTFFIPEKYTHAIYYIFPLTRLIDFCFGIFVYYLYKQYNTIQYNTIQYNTIQSPLKTGLLETGVLTLLTIFIVYADNVPEVYLFGMYYWLPMAILIFVFACCNEKKGFISVILNSRISVLAGNVSFTFYMIHTLVISCVSKVISYFGIDVNWQIKLIFCILLTFIASILISKLYEQNISKYLNKKLTEK